MASLEPSCQAGFRDDTFFNFATTPYSVSHRCTLDQNVHYGLMALWLAILALAMVEFLLAHVRGLERAPTKTRSVYIGWLVTRAVLPAYVLARPLASVGNVADAAVMLTVHVLAVSLFVGMASAHYQTLLSVLSTALTRINPNESTTRNELQRWERTVQWLSLVITVTSLVVYLVLFCVVPNALGVASFDPVTLDNVLRAGWGFNALFACIQMSIFSFVTWRVRGVIHDQVVFEREVLKHIIAGGSESDGVGVGAGARKGSTLAELETAMMINAGSGVVVALVTTALLVVATVLGMQYWILHVYLTQLPLGFLNYTRVYRPNGMFMAFAPFPVSSQTEQSRHSASSKPTSAVATSPSLKMIDMLPSTTAITITEQHSAIRVGADTVEIVDDRDLPRAVSFENVSEKHVDADSD